MRLRLACLGALWLPEVPVVVARAGEAASWWHPLGCDDLGRDGLLRLGLAATRSVGLASAVALGALGLAALLALGRERLEATRSVFRTLPPVLLILPVALRWGHLGWLPLGLVLGGILALHAEPALRERFRPLREGDALHALRVLGAGPWMQLRTWAPWVGKQVLPLFPSLWLAALWAEVVLRFIGVGPGPAADSFGLLLQQELPRLVTERSPLGIASLVTVLALAAGSTTQEPA